ncbi:helix-turn-helix domain-containing protein [Providencia rettgeri]|uniref:helix-turn-helix domain-containing protein n=1 Tax=Providencia rettgeri TaxID=587 RepID=UPI001657B5EE|nr:helix-turn-helix transcriptional regulator [Providencia rettgeri]QNP18552.1 helix-turn-helix transcriptional regulator [Providencia rettgeri]
MRVENDILNSAASSFLKKLRKQNGITEGELAILLKISQQQVSRYENGKTQLTIGRVNQYLEIFGFDWNYFTNEVIKNAKRLNGI